MIYKVGSGHPYSTIQQAFNALMADYGGSPIDEPIEVRVYPGFYTEWDLRLMNIHGWDQSPVLIQAMGDVTIELCRSLIVAPTFSHCRHIKFKGFKLRVHSFSTHPHHMIFIRNCQKFVFENLQFAPQFTVMGEPIHSFLLTDIYEISDITFRRILAPTSFFLSSYTTATGIKMDQVSCFCPDPGFCIEYSEDLEIKIENSIFLSDREVLSGSEGDLLDLSGDFNVFYSRGPHLAYVWDSDLSAMIYITNADEWRSFFKSDGGSTFSDPLFVADDDLHLKSKVGAFVNGSWQRYQEHSPGIDRADPTLTNELEPWPRGRRRNAGFYGGTIEASKSMPEPEPADIYLLCGRFNLMNVDLLPNQAQARAYAMDAVRTQIERVVGKRKPDGTEDPLVYENISFKNVVQNLLTQYGGFPSTSLVVEDIPLTFSRIVFAETSIADCLSKLAEVGCGDFLLKASGKITFRSFKAVLPTPRTLNINREVMSFTYKGPDLRNIVRTVTVEGRERPIFGYSEREITGRDYKIKNDLIETELVASEVARSYLTRFSGVTLISLRGAFLP
ncbi:TPA: hypothetical protein DCX15_01330, partial [bacterium]|nr:hypothetical protein [bacterium]